MSALPISFDTLTYARKLEQAGFTRDQAEVQAFAMREIIEDKLATKADLERVRLELQRDIEISRADLDAKVEMAKAELKTDIEKVRAELKTDIEKVRGEVKETEARLTEKLESNKHEILKWITGMVVAQAAVFVALAGVAVGLVAFYPK